MGKRIADNPLYLARYFAMNNSHLDLIWIGDDTCEKSVLKDFPISFVLRNSVRSWLEMLTASACFISHGMKDIGNFNLMRGATRIYLGHGFAIKKMGSIGRILQSQLLISTRRILRSSYSYQFYTACSQEHKKKLQEEYSAWNIDETQIVESGQPRVDFLVNHTDVKTVTDLRTHFLLTHNIPCKHKIITYLPTFRDKKTDIFSFTALKSLQHNQFQNLLKAEDALLLEKNHAFDLIRGKYENVLQDGNIFSLSNSLNIDTQELLLITDILITDYSGVYVDFLVTDRPIIHFTYDRDYYEKEDRGLYFDLSQIAGGPIVDDFNSLYVALKKCLHDPNSGKKQRIMTRNKLAEFERGIACKKISEIVLRSLK